VKIGFELIPIIGTRLCGHFGALGALKPLHSAY